MRIVGYVRVSTDEQAANGAGLVAQRDAIANEADAEDGRSSRSMRIGVSAADASTAVSVSPQP